MTLLPLDLRFGFEDALQQDGIFRHHTPLLDLQDLDQSALLGQFVFPGRQLTFRSLARGSLSIIER